MAKPMTDERLSEIEKFAKEVHTAPPEVLTVLPLAFQSTVLELLAEIRRLRRDLAEARESSATYRRYVHELYEINKELTVLAPKIFASGADEQAVSEWSRLADKNEHTEQAAKEKGDG
jgi:hypothetical protein